MRDELVIIADYYYVVHNATTTGTACIFNFPRDVFHVCDNRRGCCHLSFRRILMAIYFSKNLIIMKRCIRSAGSISYHIGDTRDIFSIVMHSTFVQRVPKHRSFIGQRMAKTQRLRSPIILVIGDEGHPPL